MLVVFSNGAMLSVSDKYDTVNERTEEISELMKLHIQGVWQNAHKFIRQLAHC